MYWYYWAAHGLENAWKLFLETVFIFLPMVEKATPSADYVNQPKQCAVHFTQNTICSNLYLMLKYLVKYLYLGCTHECKYQKLACYSIFNFLLCYESRVSKSKMVIQWCTSPMKYQIVVFKLSACAYSCITQVFEI